MQHIRAKLPNKAERHKLFGSVSPGNRTKPIEKNYMADLQNTKNNFLFDLDHVGVTNVKHPVKLKSLIEPREQSTVANFSLTSSILKDSKGTNMSRFTEQLHHYHTNGGFLLSIANLKRFTKELAHRLEQEDATLEVNFPWFFERSGPSSTLAGLNHADARIYVHYKKEVGYSIKVGLTATITTLCPCSKEISEYSAHNQRGLVTIEIDLDEDFDETQNDWKQVILEAAESNASARIHPILKRPDEKIVTEHAYENPRFVEDMVRLVAADLYELSFVKAFHVKCQNQESIHLHDAIASITFNKEKD